jgi:hypothetical protein
MKRSTSNVKTLTELIIGKICRAYRQFCHLMSDNRDVPRLQRPDPVPSSQTLYSSVSPDGIASSLRRDPSVDFRSGCTGFARVCEEQANNLRQNGLSPGFARSGFTHTVKYVFYAARLSFVTLCRVG